MKTIFLLLSGGLTISSTIPYMHDILRKRTKPRIVSWFNWAVLDAIVTAAALSARQYPSVVLSLAEGIACLAVVVLGLRHGDRKFEFIDVICQAGAIAGLILWALFDSPLVALVATVSVDFIAGVPTIRHSWQKPQEETTSAYAMVMASSLCALAATRYAHPKAAGLVFPIYLFFTSSSFVVILLASPHRLRRRKKHAA